MKKSGRYFLVFLVISLSSSARAMAQGSQSDSSFYQSAVYNTIDLYRQFASDQSRLYNGRRYKPYDIPFVVGVPFFQSDWFTEGTIIYEDGYYDKVMLLYDEVKELVILRAEVTIELINERIAAFTIGEHKFQRLVKDSLNTGFATGFYEKLFSGKIEIYKKEKKTIIENLSNSEGVRGDIDVKIYYYIKKNGRYQLIKKKANIYEVLNDRSKEIQQFIKSNKLNFKHDRENTLIKVAGYYDQLTK